MNAYEWEIEKKNSFRYCDFEIQHKTSCEITPSHRIRGIIAIPGNTILII